MASAKHHYLVTCLAAFREVSKAKYGIPFDLLSIERTVAALSSAAVIAGRVVRSPRIDEGSHRASGSSSSKPARNLADRGARRRVLHPLRLRRRR